MTPASIRYKNPGAMYPGPSSRAFGSRRYEVIGGGHKIAVFDTYEHGAAALFHLLNRVYKGMRLDKAIQKWSGNNNVNSYLETIEQHSHLTRNTFIDGELIDTSADLIALARAMAWHEAGQEFPLDAQGWSHAYDMFKAEIEGTLVVPPAHGGPNVTALEWAKKRLGEREVPGDGDNPFIVWCFAQVGRPAVTDDEIPWCAAFAGAALKDSGNHYLEGNLLAREYLKYGVELSEPEIGALVIMKRGSSSWQGHVAFVSYVDAHVIRYIGGNQADAVTEETISRNDARILGYRRAVPKLKPVKEVIKEDSVQYKSVGILTTLSALIATSWDAVVDGLASAVDFIAHSLGALPEAASEVERTTGAVERISQSSGTPWPAKVALVIALLSLSFNLYNTWKRKRERGERGDDG